MWDHTDKCQFTQNEDRKASPDKEEGFMLTKGTVLQKAEQV